jgi:Ni/Co efflux regulator RcnB
VKKLYSLSLPVNPAEEGENIMWRIAVLIIVTLTITIPVQAKQNKQKKYETSQYVVEKQVTVEQREALNPGEAFSPAERNLIRAQLLGQKRTTSQRNHKKLPPGLQKKIARGKALPPGWQKKVAPGQSLDYHVYRQGESLPDVLLRRLPPPPTGSEILRVEEKIIRLNAATRTILDVFDLTPTR